MIKKTRSEIMRCVPNKDTSIEIIVRKYLFSHGFRYRKNVKTLPGTPDIVLKKYKTVIFINGCFWHGHENCKRHRVPKTNNEYWTSKIKRNIDRDREIIADNSEKGWKVVTIWECEILGDLEGKMGELCDDIRKNYEQNRYI